jgi:hypothetical protein
MTDTRAAKRQQHLKNTAREALGNAKRDRQAGNRQEADAELRRAAEARHLLVINHLDPRFEKEFAKSIDTFEGNPPDFAPKGETPAAARRRRALAAHLYNADKAQPIPR